MDNGSAGSTIPASYIQYKDLMVRFIAERIKLAIPSELKVILRVSVLFFKRKGVCNITNQLADALPRTLFSKEKIFPILIFFSPFYNLTFTR